MNVEILPDATIDEELTQEALALIQDMMGCQACWIYRLDGGRERLRLVGCRGDGAPAATIALNSADPHSRCVYEHTLVQESNHESQEKPGTLWVMPMGGTGGIWGVLGLTFAHKPALNDVERLQRLSRFLASGLVRPPTPVEREAEVLTEAALSFFTSLDPDEVVLRIARLVKQYTQATGCVILEADQEHQLLRTRVALHPHGEILQRLEVPFGMGVVGWVAESGEGVCIEDAQQDPRWIALVDTDAPPQAVFAHPIFLHNELLGVFIVSRPKERPFSKHETRVLKRLAQPAAIALGNAQRYHMARKRAERLQLINLLAQDIAKLTTTDAILRQTVIRIYQQFAGCHVLAFATDARQTLRLVASEGAQAGQSAQDEQKLFALARLAESALRSMILSRKDVQQSLALENVESIVVAPIRYGQKFLGVVCILSDDCCAFVEEDRLFVDALADQVALSIQQVTLIRQEQQRAERMEMVNRITASLRSLLDERTLCESVVDILYQQVGYSHISIYMYEEPDALRCCTSRGYEPERITWVIKRDQGAMWKAVDSGQTLYIPDVSQEPTVLYDVDDLQAMIAIPIIQQDKVIGVLNVETTEPEGLSPEDAVMLEFVADHFAIALRTAHLYSTLQQHIRNIAAIINVGKALSLEQDLDELLRHLLNNLQEILGADLGASIILFDEEQDAFVRAIHVVPERQQDAPYLNLLPRPGGNAWRILQSPDPVIISDTTQAQNLHPSVIASNMRSIAGASLRYQGQRLGVLLLNASEPGRFQEQDHLDFLRLFANQAAVVIGHARLYRSLQLQTLALQQAYQRLQDLQRMKETFMRSMSHEIRTPLAVIKGYADALSEGALGELTEEQIAILNMMKEKTDAVIALMQDTMAVLRVQDSKVGMEPVDPLEIAKKAVSVITDAAREKSLRINLEVDVSTLPFVEGNKQQLQIVFDKLLESAVNWSALDSEISIHLSQVGDKVRTTINISGSGIPQEQLDAIFQPDSEVDIDRVRHYGGGALGLFVAKRILVAHEGCLWAETEPGVGATFCFELSAIDQVDT